MRINIFVFLSFFVLARCSLLEMSQVLWSRLLAGGLTKSGHLDPLRVPVVKVDQSEGNTSYRMVLRNVEIKGLNHSTVESVHIARGRLKSNLSDDEAGYVSYSDLRELDEIRYRFHTLVKEPKPRNGTESPERLTYHSNRDNLNSETRDDVDVVYPENYRPFETARQNDRNRQDFGKTADQQRQENEGIRCFGSCVTNRNPTAGFTGGRRLEDAERTRANRKYGEFREEEETDTRGSASESFEQKRKFGNVGQPADEKIWSTPESRNNYRKYVSPVVDHPAGSREAEVNSAAYRDNVRRSNFNLFRQRMEHGTNRSQTIYQTPPGYVDIVYADNDDQRIRHFGGFRRTENENMNVYGLEDIRRVRIWCRKPL